MSSSVRGKSVTLTTTSINQALGTSEDGLDREALVEEVDLLPLDEKVLDAKEWLLHTFVATNLVDRNGSFDYITTEDLLLIFAISQGLQIDFGSFMLSKIQFVFEKAKRQKLLNIKRAISLPYGKFICKVFIAHGIFTKGVMALPFVEGPLDHVSLLWAHYCLHQENWVRTSSLT